MRSLITILLLAYGGLNFAIAGAIDDVASRFDRHGLWLNGLFIPIQAPEDIEDKILAEKILAAYNKPTERLHILERKEISALKIGTSGMKAMHVRVERASMLPPQATIHPQAWVIVYRFQGKETGWWSRIYPIEKEEQPNQ